MTTSDVVALAVVAAVAVVPLAAVMVFVVLRGYSVNLTMKRPGVSWRHKRDDGDDDR